MTYKEDDFEMVHDDTERAYDIAMNQMRDRAVKCFETNGIVYPLERGNLAKKSVYRIMCKYGCNGCKSRARVCVPQLGPEGSLFLSNVDEDVLAREPVLQNLRNFAKHRPISAFFYSKYCFFYATNTPSKNGSPAVCTTHRMSRGHCRLASRV